MIVQQGSQSIPGGVDEVSVVFPQALPETPDVLLAVVENVSGDPVKLAIKPTVTTKSATGFTCGLSQETNTGNYTLVWVLGGSEIVFELALAVGRRISTLNLQTTGLQDDDYMPVVRAYPTPHTKRIRWGTLRAGLVRYVASPPSSPSAPGEPGDFYAGPEGFWVRGSSEWQFYGALDEAPPVLSVNGATGIVELETQDIIGLVQELEGKQVWTVQAQEFPVDFTAPRVWGTRGTPMTGEITQDLMGARLGVVQKVYHQDSVEPTYPADWEPMGDAVYIPGELNVLYCESVGSGVVEYWITQEG